MDNLKIIASKENWIETKSIEALKNISKYKNIVRVVGLPDLSVGLVPNGTAVISKDRIFPHLIGSDIGCGMSLFEIPIKNKKIKLDKFQKILEKTSLSNIEISKHEYKYNQGTIGRGNHFAELHFVNKILDNSTFNKNINSQKSLFILVHSGSRALGQKIFDKYSGTYIPEEGLSLSSNEAKEYIKEHDLAQLFAKKNRELIALKILKTLKISTTAKLLSDTAHNSISQIKEGFLHRKGATPVDKGLVMIAGTRGSLSYLVKPKRITFDSNYSLAHGAGRKWERSSVEKRLKNLYSKEKLLRTKIGSRVICSNSKLLYEEAPEAYKDIEIIIKDLVNEDLIDVVASFKPIITYKE